MPGTSTSGSPNIAILDSQIFADHCTGNFCVDITPSTYIASGKNNVQGAKIQITDPYGVVIRPYGSSFDISQATSGGMDEQVCFAIPTLAGTYKWGKYTISVQLTDEDGTIYTVTNTVTICAPNSKDKTKNYGSLSARITGSCKDGKLYVITDTVPNYNGRMVESQENDFELLYPTSSGLPALETTIGSFSVQLYEGTYSFSGEICATYNFGDHVYVNVKYKIKKERTVRCIIDECCVFEKLEELNMRLKSDCTVAEREKTTNIILEALNYLKTIELAAECSKDPSEYIEALESLLGCVCTCNCAEGTPIINNNPSKDFLIQGCNVDKQTVGLTDVYTIENYDYMVSVVDNGGALVISTATLDGCTKTQSITFDISVVYTQIKSLANASDVESAFWASVINKMLNSINGTCVTSAWAAYTFKQRIEAIVNSICACCNCSAVITSYQADKSGADVIISWTATGAFYVDVYVDDVFIGRVLSSTQQITASGYADGKEHSYSIIPVCSNNKFGIAAADVFALLGCPSISPPVVSSNFVNDACPYDLSTLLSSPPAGISYEWHTQNNVNASTLMADPTQASSGVYYVFAKDTDGCYSTSTEVTLVCVEASSCTAPQNLSVQKFLTVFRVLFSSAAFPPPGNSYTVKRRLSSDPDVDGSYTTLGAPTFDSGLGQWVVLDASAANNTLYTYKAISNCGGSPPSTPYITYEFANLICPALNLTPGETQIDYSFTHVGGNVDKYVVQLYDSTGTSLLASDTHTPAFPTPVTGSFAGLTANTSYKVRVIVYIGTYSKTCTMSSTATTGAAGDNIFWFLNGVAGARLTIYDDDSPQNELLNVASTTTPQSGEVSGITGQATICAEWNSGSGNVIKMRICDALGNQVYYDGDITIGEGQSCYTTVTLPNSAAPYYVYVTAGSIEPASCS